MVVFTQSHHRRQQFYELLCESCPKQLGNMFKKISPDRLLQFLAIPSIIVIREVILFNPNGPHRDASNNIQPPRKFA